MTTLPAYLLEALRLLAAGKPQPCRDELEASGLAAWEPTGADSQTLRPTAVGRLVLEAERLGLARAAEKIEKLQASEIDNARRARRAGAETSARTHDDEAAGLATAVVTLRAMAEEGAR